MREVAVSEECGRLSVENSASDSSDEPRVVGLAGPSGVGKSIASMVVGRENVRPSSGKGVLWLHVGQRAKQRLLDLVLRLADMLYEKVMLKTCRQSQTGSLKNDGAVGAAYIQEVVDKSSRYFLLVAGDVWDEGMLTELKRAGVLGVLHQPSRRYAP